MAVQLLLKGGPLDGEIQVVQSTRTDPNHVLTFNIPTHQSYDVNGDVIDKGLLVNYVFSGEVPLKQGGHIDTTVPGVWVGDDRVEHNYLYHYAGPVGSYVPLPPPINPGDILPGVGYGNEAYGKGTYGKG
jgi:hypothetical protein